MVDETETPDTGVTDFRILPPQRPNLEGTVEDTTVETSFNGNGNENHSSGIDTTYLEPNYSAMPTLEIGTLVHKPGSGFSFKGWEYEDGITYSDIIAWLRNEGKISCDPDRAMVKEITKGIPITKCHAAIIIIDPEPEKVRIAKDMLGDMQVARYRLTDIQTGLEGIPKEDRAKMNGILCSVATHIVYPEDY